MIGISDEFVENEQCKNLIAYTKETLHKPILLAVLGKTTNWRNTNLNILLADEVSGINWVQLFTLYFITL